MGLKVRLADRFWCGVLVLGACGLGACASQGTAPLGTLAPVAADTLAPGLIHVHYTGAGAAFDAQLVAIDLRHPELRVESALAQGTIAGRERTGVMARGRTRARDSVIVAINADFFDLETGEVENNQVIDGVIVRGTPLTDSPHDTFDNIHTQVAITMDGRPLLERFRFQGTATLAGGDTVRIDRVNSSGDSANVVLYTPVHDRPTPDLPNGTHFRLERLSSQADTTVYRVADELGDESVMVPTDAAILAAREPAATTLRQALPHGDSLRVALGFQPDRGPIRTLVGGWPRLLRNGENVAIEADDVEGTFPRFSKARHPRTAVGFSRDSTILYLVTVDGRQDSSVGMTLNELAAFMLGIGAHDALNLDGGGSTTLVIRGDIVNAPSDSAGERTVGNALLVTRRQLPQDRGDR